MRAARQRKLHGDLDFTRGLIYKVVNRIEIFLIFLIKIPFERLTNAVGCAIIIKISAGMKMLYTNNAKELKNVTDRNGAAKEVFGGSRFSVFQFDIRFFDNVD